MRVCIHTHTYIYYLFNYLFILYECVCVPIFKYRCKCIDIINIYHMFEGSDFSWLPIAVENGGSPSFVQSAPSDRRYVLQGAAGTKRPHGETPEL